MNKFKIPVVAEAGALQKALGLPAVKRTSTNNYEAGRITIRTFRVPTPNTFGSYALYYNPGNSTGWCVLSIYEDCDWNEVNGITMRVPLGKTRVQIRGSATDQLLDTLLETYRELERQIDIKMRGKRQQQIEDPEEELAGTRWA